MPLQQYSAWGGLSGTAVPFSVENAPEAVVVVTDNGHQALNHQALLAQGVTDVVTPVNAVSAVCWVKDISGTGTTVWPASGLIDNQSSFLLPLYGAVMVLCDGTNWWVF